VDFSLIHIERTLDVGVCLDILTDKYIFDSISEDGATFKTLKVDVINDYWLTIKNTDGFIGVVQFKQKFNKCYDCHIHILKEHRKESSLDAGAKILDWCKENLKGSLLYTNIPEFCPNVKNFLLNFGFVENGVLHKAWFKNGKAHNMNILTREV
tara:strand:- start:178 stop:639 length:462 start_codon:yes stop_codon:yes gene_type:complete